MDKWSADFCNDPFDDYNLVVEILLNDEEIAVIKLDNNGTYINWYPHEKEVSIPLDWLLGLMLEAKKRLEANL